MTFWLCVLSPLFFMNYVFFMILVVSFCTLFNNMTKRRSRLSPLGWLVCTWLWCQVLRRN
uniref:Uncharacterized protein n=1 Tax=Arundo donax TaxID=35708 RepID=A0A0A8YRX6_ARUDO